MIYQALDGKRYDIANLDPKEKDIFEHLKAIYHEARSWTDFQERTAYMTIETLKKTRGKEWSKSDLYHIQLDMLGRVGVVKGEFKQQTLTEMILEEEK